MLIVTLSGPATPQDEALTADTAFRVLRNLGVTDIAAYRAFLREREKPLECLSLEALAWHAVVRETTKNAPRGVECTIVAADPGDGKFGEGDST